MSVPPPAILPAGVEPLRITTGRGDLAALSCGNPADPPVLLVPGFTGSKEDFLPILRPLADARLAVTAIDQMGQFESPGSGDPADYTLAGFTADVLEVIAAAGRPVHLVGHSFGGLVGREATLASPGSVASLTLMDSGPGPLPKAHWPILRALIGMIPVATMTQIWLAKLDMDRQMGAPPLPSEVADFLRTRWISNDARSMAGIAEILMSVPDRTDELAATLTRHGIPALVMFGEGDDTAWYIPEQIAMADRLGVPAVSIPGAAHSPAVENPGITAKELVGFITSQHV